MLYLPKNSYLTKIIMSCTENLSQFKAADFKKVIENKKADWEHDAKMCKFLTPKTLFSKEHFSIYLNQQIKPKNTFYAPL